MVEEELKAIEGIDWMINFDLLWNLRHPIQTWKSIQSMILRSRWYIQMGEVFIQQDYYPLYKIMRKNTILIDFGAYIGDTAIYFAMNPNVKKVEAYEPNIEAYKKCQMNVGISPFKDKINIHNNAVYHSHGRVNMTSDAMSAGNMVSEGTEVVALTLNEILDGKRNVAIKCDIEGEEHGIFSGQVSLANVYAIMLEYHGQVGSLLKTLRSEGFKVTATAVPSDPKRGYIFAVR